VVFIRITFKKLQRCHTKAAVQIIILTPSTN